MVLTAGQGISQNMATTGDAHIQAGTTLFAQAVNGTFLLADLGNGAGDPGNQVAGQRCCSRMRQTWSTPMLLQRHAGNRSQ